MYFGYNNRFEWAMDIAKEKRAKELEGLNPVKKEDPEIEELRKESMKMNLEQGDFLSMVLASFRVFAPLFIILILILILTLGLL